MPYRGGGLECECFEPGESDVRTPLHDLVGHLCNPDDDVVAQHKQLEAVRATWSKRLLLSEADWADVADWTATRSASG